MHHERASEAAAGKQLAQFQMMLVKPAHKAQLDQPAAHRAFRMDNREACFGRHGERLFAENRFARPEAGERIRMRSGSAWSQGGVSSAQEWERMVSEESIRAASPLKVTLHR